MSDYGNSAAFNFKTGAGQNADNQIADMQYAANLQKQNEAMAMAKAKMFADDLEFQNGSNPYYTAIIQKENQDLLRNISQIRRDNPSTWATDPEIYGQMKMIKHQSKSTPAVLGSTAYMDAVKQYQEFNKLAQKNPSAYNLDQLAAFRQKLDAYNNMTPDQPLPPPLTFTPPDEIPNFDEIHRKTADAIDPDEFTKVNNGRSGAYFGRVSDDTLTKEAEALYSRNKRYYDYVYKNEPDRIAKIKAELYAPSKKVYNNGERNILADQKEFERFKRGLDANAGKGKSAYDMSFLNTKRAVVGDDLLAQTFTRTVPNFYKDATGKLVPNTSYEFYFDGDAITDPNEKGTKIMPGKFYNSLDWGKANNYLYDPIGPSGQDGTDLDVKPEFKDYVSIIPNPKPNAKEPFLVEVKATARANANTALYRSRFDNIAAKMTTKQRDAAGVEESTMEDGSQPATIIQNGYTYTLNPQTGQYE